MVPDEKHITLTSGWGREKKGTGYLEMGDFKGHEHIIYQENQKERIAEI